MTDEEMLILGVGALLYFKGKGGAAVTPKQLPPTSTKTAPTTKTTAPAKSPTTTNKRLAGLRGRAYQKAAQDWIPVLERLGATSEEAAGLARWIGIESSGNPLARSQIGERGLLQCTEATRKLVPFTDSEWNMMASAATSRETHARLALKQYAFHVNRAKIGGGPPARPARDALWYAKAHHMRPADLRGTTARPSADMAAQFAAGRAKTDREILRLATANMVAFGTIEPLPAAVARK